MKGIPQLRNYDYLSSNVKEEVINVLSKVQSYSFEKLNITKQMFLNKIKFSYQWALSKKRERNILIEQAILYVEENNVENILLLTFINKLINLNVIVVVDENTNKIICVLY